jgi:hypothetical protein
MNPIKITAVTTDPAGRCRRWTRNLASKARSSGFVAEPTTDAHIAAYIEKNLPSLFYGCTIRVAFPVGTTFDGVVDPDTHKFSFDDEGGAQ